MVNARMSVGRWRTLEEDKRGATLTFRNASVEEVFAIPLLQNFFVNITEIQFIMLCKFLAHIVQYLKACFIWGAKIQKVDRKTK